MAFIVEDGTAKEDATAYVDTAYADTYFTDRGNDTWLGLTSDAKREAIIKATDYIDKRFRRDFVGYARRKEQALAWPRQDACDANGWYLNSDEMPKNLLQATCEYALQAATIGELLTQSSTSGTASPKVAETIKVGPITISDKYQETSAQARVTGVDVISSSNLSEYPAADLLIQDLLTYDNNDIVRG